MTAAKADMSELSMVSITMGEWLKFRSRRGVVAFLALTVVIGLFVCVVAGLLLASEWRTDPQAARSLLSTMPSVAAYVTALLLGVTVATWLTGEFTSGSNCLTLLAVPRRRLVFASRVTLVVLLASVLGTGAAVVGATSAVLFVGANAVAEAMRQSPFWLSVIATLCVCVCSGLICFAAATLVRTPLPAMGVFASLFFVLPNVEAYISLTGGSNWVSGVLAMLPGSLVSAVLTPSADGVGSLSPLVASALLAGWTAIALFGAARHFEWYD